MSRCFLGEAIASTASNGWSVLLEKPVRGIVLFFFSDKRVNMVDDATFEPREICFSFFFFDDAWLKFDASQLERNTTFTSRLDVKLSRQNYFCSLE